MKRFFFNPNPFPDIRFGYSELFGVKRLGAVLSDTLFDNALGIDLGDMVNHRLLGGPVLMNLHGI